MIMQFESSLCLSRYLARLPCFLLPPNQFLNFGSSPLATPFGVGSYVIIVYFRCDCKIYSCIIGIYFEHGSCTKIEQCMGVLVD